jgi:hypothetical protein
MPSLDDLVERLRQAASAEFAFALTREGVLVTGDAPQAMPERGRKCLASSAEVLIGKRDIGFLSLLRSELVPYGGPGPIDIGFGVAASERIVCVVMTNSGRRDAVRELLEQHLPIIEAFLAPPDAPNAAPHIEIRKHAPLGRETIAAIELDTLLHDAPVITVGIAPKLGRETLAAIELDTLKESAPVITVKPAPPLGRETLAAIYVDEDKHEAPQIVAEPARRLGRETLAAIELDNAIEGPPIERPVIPPDVRRKTLPWIEPLPASIRMMPSPINESAKKT